MHHQKYTFFILVLFVLSVFVSCSKTTSNEALPTSGTPTASVSGELNNPDGLSDGTMASDAASPQSQTSPSPTAAPSATPTPSPTATPSPSPTVTPTPTPVLTTITCSFTGDVTLGSDLINQPSYRNFYKMYDTVQDDAYFFSNVLPYFEADDLTLVNLEGVLSDRGTRRDKKFAFRGPRSYVNILTEGSVEAVSLANNHSSDYGEISHEDTREILTEAGILFACEDLVSYTTIKDIKIAMISIFVAQHGIDGSKTLLDTTIAEAKEQEADLIFTSFHWGTEATSILDEEQTVLAHYAVDLGADLVLGHHPHVLQAIEKYNDTYIVYSLGNFCFGGNTNPRDKDTMIFQCTFSFTDYAQNTEETAVRIIPCRVSSISEYNDYRPTPQLGEEAERIITKLNGYCESYGLTFVKESDGIYIPAEEASH